MKPIYAVVFLTLAVLGAGCASTQTNVPVEIDGWVYPISPVGGVTPVFVGIKCKTSCEGLSTSDTPYITRAEIYALNDTGKYAQALPLDDAIQQSGGAEVLCNSLMGGMTAGKRAEKLFGAGSIPGNTPILFPLELLYAISGYAAAGRPEFALEQIALAEAEDSGGGSHRQERGWRGWVFFPNGNYRTVRLNVMQNGGQNTKTTLELPWTETFAPPAHPDKSKKDRDETLSQPNPALMMHETLCHRNCLLKMFAHRRASMVDPQISPFESCD